MNETLNEEWIWVPFEVEKKFDGWRIDRFLAARLSGYSRSKVQSMMTDLRITKGGKPAKAHTRVHCADKIAIAYPRKPEKPLAADASLPVLYEDDHLLIINKPTDLLSHPTDKVVENTVLGILRHSRKDLPALHLLHRLDRETSGVLALAKNPKAARAWTQAMERREVQKEYVAFVHGKLKCKKGEIDLPIGREGGAIHVRQWVNTLQAVEARTRYEVISEFGFRSSDLKSRKSAIRNPNSDISVLRVFPATGRLHQIRVHFAALGHPLLGDYLYTGQGELYLKLIKEGLSESDRQRLGFGRIALHAASLSFRHPVTKDPMKIEASLPPDMATFLKNLSA